MESRGHAVRQNGTQRAALLLARDHIECEQHGQQAENDLDQKEKIKTTERGQCREILRFDVARIHRRSIICKRIINRHVGLGAARQRRQQSRSPVGPKIPGTLLFSLIISVLTVEGVAPGLVILVIDKSTQRHEKHAENGERNEALIQQTVLNFFSDEKREHDSDWIQDGYAQSHATL